MCNAYRLGDDAAVPDQLGGEVLRQLLREPRLVRRTDRAPVIRAGLPPVLMRWGFERAGLGTVNNAREEQLEAPMWRSAFSERRCLVPATAWYEWSGPKGRKRTHLFHRVDGELALFAGLWEESESFGLCFSVITTPANTVAGAVHDRMPAYLERDEASAYLAGSMRRFAPAGHALLIEDAPNPLLRRSQEPPLQGELF